MVAAAWVAVAVLAVAGLLPNGAFAGDVCVNAGSGTYPPGSPCPIAGATVFTTIAAAVSHSRTQNGDSVYIASGAYDETVSVTKSLTLVGYAHGVPAGPSLSPTNRRHDYPSPSAILETVIAPSSGSATAAVLVPASARLTLTLRGLLIATADGVRGVEIDAPNSALNITNCIITGRGLAANSNAKPAIHFTGDASTTGSLGFSLAASNNFIRGGSHGVEFQGPASTTGASALKPFALTGNAIVDVATAVSVASTYKSASAGTQQGTISLNNIKNVDNGIVLSGPGIYTVTANTIEAGPGNTAGYAIRWRPSDGGHGYPTAGTIENNEIGSTASTTFGAGGIQLVNAGPGATPRSISIRNNLVQPYAVANANKKILLELTTTVPNPGQAAAFCIDASPNAFAPSTVNRGAYPNLGPNSVTVERYGTYAGLGACANVVGVATASDRLVASTWFYAWADATAPGVPGFRPSTFELGEEGLIVDPCLDNNGGCAAGANCTNNDGVAVCTGEGQGDPHFSGFDGTPFFFDGYEGASFALLSERDHQVNALFGSVGPAHGVDSTIWMTAFGVRHSSGLQFSISIDTDPKHIKLIHDPTAKHETKMRVVMPEKAFSIVLNGVPRDDLLYSGHVVHGPAEGAAAAKNNLPKTRGKAPLLYFPPASAVNPGDARDGPLVVFKSAEMELTIRKETEDAAHLDLDVKILKTLDAMHGVLGQTLQWARDGDGPSHVEDGVLVGNDADFEVVGGLLGTSFKHGTLFGASVQRRRRQRLLRRLASKDDDGGDNDDGFSLLRQNWQEESTGSGEFAAAALLAARPALFEAHSESSSARHQW